MNSDAVDFFYLQSYIDLAISSFVRLLTKLEQLIHRYKAKTGEKR
jgi:hypothetical protein